MINQRVGDLLEIQFEQRWYYVVVLTRVVMFGGNIVFAFHTSGEKKTLEELLQSYDGFNICTDLGYAKKSGLVQRLHKFKDVQPYFKTRLIKSCHPGRKEAPLEKAGLWFIASISEPGTWLLRTEVLDIEQRSAMDGGCSSFDLTAAKILAQYTPDKNIRINGAP
jgi:hypothetical protein